MTYETKNIVYICHEQWSTDRCIHDGRKGKEKKCVCVCVYACVCELRMKRKTLI